MGKNNDSVNELNTHHMNKNYLKDAKLDETIQATTHLEEAIQHADVYLMALPTKAMREVATNIDKLLTSKKHLYTLLRELKMVHLNVCLK